MAEVVDLVSDSDDDNQAPAVPRPAQDRLCPFWSLTKAFNRSTAGGQAVHSCKKRGRVNSNDETAAEQAAAKRRIMEHAAHVNAANPPAARAAALSAAGTLGPAGQATGRSPGAAASDTAGSDGAAEADAAKQTIMQHAAQVNQGNSWLAQLHAERTQRRGQPSAAPADPAPSSSQGPRAGQAGSGGRIVASASAAASARGANAGQPASGGSNAACGSAAASGSGGSSGAGKLTLLTYNVWFAEDVALKERMAGIGRIVEEKGYPHFICFQEMTPNIYVMLSKAAWWSRYTASPMEHSSYFTTLLFRKADVAVSAPLCFVPFAKSVMGRGIHMVGARVGRHSVRVATSHLESMCGWNQTYSAERCAQAKQALTLLDGAQEPNVLYAGDMNWDESKDGQLPVPHGWQDAWTSLKPGDPGLTYDPKANPMLGPYNRIRKRLDRVFAKLANWRLEGIEMVGTRAIPGVTYQKQSKKGPSTLPVLPSDHFGLFLTLAPLP
ncbi:hypothetical protein WJX72_006035 [[Myrmecia] bisecta]|uniref:Endonuclease/exonuclease/phosphatase domain-containing protein n=1 Tax=[Myrmecia] bisecta TaxID=41462 RepID=A0AAW1P3Y1_9CHLO